MLQPATPATQRSLPWGSAELPHGREGCRGGVSVGGVGGADVEQEAVLGGAGFSPLNSGQVGGPSTLHSLTGGAWGGRVHRTPRS